jgi:TolB-like protein
LSLFSELKRRNVFRVGAAYLVMSWLVIQVVETIFPAFGFGDAAVRIAVILLAIGVVPVMVVTWAFELTPEGLKKDRDVDRSQAIPPDTVQKLDRVILIALAVGLAYFAVDKLVLEPVRDAELVEATTVAVTEQFADSWKAEIPDLSIAVLPFVNMSGDEHKDYFSAGLSEDIATAVSKFTNLRVISPQLTYRYRDAPELDAVGKELGASYIIAGSVRVEPGIVRVNARLIDVSSNTQLWANTYDEELTATNLFKVQSDVAARVVATIADSTGVLSKVGQEQIRAQPTYSLEAYECVLRSHGYRRIHDTKSHRAARDCLEMAIELDPDYADAWAHLAFLYREEFHHERNLQPNPLERALSAAQRAIELDPSNHMARFAMAFTRKSRGEWQAFVSQVEKALELNPYDATTLAMFGAAFVYHGEINKGIELVERARALIPDPPDWIYIPYASAYYQRGQYDEVMDALSNWNQGRNAPQWHLHHTIALAQLDRLEEAAEALQAYFEVDPAIAEDPLLKLRKYVSSDEVAEIYLTGLIKAGLQLEPRSH